MSGKRSPGLMVMIKLFHYLFIIFNKIKDSHRENEMLHTCSYKYNAVNKSVDKKCLPKLCRLLQLHVAFLQFHFDKTKVARRFL